MPSLSPNSPQNQRTRKAKSPASEAVDTEKPKKQLVYAKVRKNRFVKAGEIHSSMERDRFLAVMEAAGKSGLLGEKSARVGSRVSQRLVTTAMEKTGIESTTDLIEYALANLAIEDTFAQTFSATHGTVDPSIDLEF